MFLFFNLNKTKNKKLTKDKKAKNSGKILKQEDKKQRKTVKSQITKKQNKQKKVVKTTPRYEFLYEALRSARIRANLTQMELAQKSKIARSTIARIESGEWNTEVETLMRLAEAMNMKLVIFFEEKK